MTTHPGFASLTARFEAARPQLGAIAYRMLGSIDDAQDVVQEAWLRLERAERQRHRRDSQSGRVADHRGGTDLPEHLARSPTLRSQGASAHGWRIRSWTPYGEFDPEHRAVLADAVGLALFVVLDTLPPAERLAFVLHDVFAVPFEQIAPVVDRSPEATRKLASRARRRIEQAVPFPTTSWPPNARSSMPSSPPGAAATSTA